MKLRKVLAAAAAAAVAASAMSAIATAESYNGYIGFQHIMWGFRNAWTEASYGKDTPYFNTGIVWGGNDEEAYPEYADKFDYDINGYVFDDVQYTDTVITGDGTYTVEAKGYKWGLEGDNDFNLVFVSTDIPYVEDGPVKCTEAKVIVDGEVAQTIANPMIVNEAGYVLISLKNIWNPDITDPYTGAYPTDSLAIEFTIEGLGSAAAEEAPAEEAPAEETPAAGNVDAATDSSKGSPDTGIESVAVIGGLALLAGAGIALTRKRK